MEGLSNMKLIILLYLAIGMLYWAVITDKLLENRLNELNDILNRTNKPWMKYAAMVAASLYIIIFWPMVMLSKPKK